MNDIENIINGLKATPLILQNLIASIPGQRMLENRKPGKWTIHEQVCHLAQAEDMIYRRFLSFQQFEEPTFKSYFPEKSEGTKVLLELHLDKEMIHFDERRKETVSLITEFDEAIWRRKGIHPEFEEYGAYIFLRHVLMHDHFHMYRIEELWLTKDTFL